MEGQKSARSRLMPEVNDRIFDILSDLGGEDGEFLCECEDETCVETIQMTLREYAALPGDTERTRLRAATHER